MGLNTLRATMPKVIVVQDRIFGEAGHPGGALLERLLHVDSNLAEYPA
jgi:hypothetical protein